MASEEMDPADLRRRWARSLDAALQADGWGQIVEALDAYERLGRMINSSIEGLRPDAAMRAMLNKTVLCVNMRAKALKSETEADAAAGPSIDQMKTLGPFIRALFTDEQEAFPFNVARLGGRGAAVELDSSAAGGKEEEEHRGGSLLPAPALRAGEQYISVEVEKWGLKDAETYVDPFVTVLVYGTCLTSCVGAGVGVFVWCVGVTSARVRAMAPTRCVTVAVQPWRASLLGPAASRHPRIA